MSEFDPDAWRKWDQKSQEQLAQRLQKQLSSEEPKYWFCTRGRSCDGKPHEGFDYPHARGQQWPPPGSDWTTWFLSGGRGGGKTATGSQYTRKVTENIERSIVVGPTAAHVRDVMVEGDSGLLSAFDRAKVDVTWEPSKRKITNLETGAVIFAFSGEEPERLRGPNSGFLWVDEPAHIPLIETVWDNAMLGLRIGKRPHALCTTTPLPTEWVRRIIKDPDTRLSVVTTYDNLDNLAPTFRKAILSKYEGTRLGRQELNGELLEDVEGALWSWEMITENREETLTFEDMDRIVVGIDPSGTSSKRRDETGIVAVGRKDDHLYVLDDKSGHYSPDGWAKAAWAMFDRFSADNIVAEKNYGGEMVRSTLQHARKDMNGGDLFNSIELVTSRRGKQLRAEPVVGLYEQGRVHHVGTFAELETQQTTWVPGISDSPDRVDALVHAIIAIGERSSGAVTMHIPRGNFGTSLTSQTRTDVWGRKVRL